MSPEQARAELRELLSSISERAMSAQWYGDLEFVIWDRIGGGPSLLAGFPLTHDLLDRLKHLSEVSGGWLFYSDEAEKVTGDGIVFIDIDTWMAMYDRWLQRVPEESRPRDR